MNNELKVKDILRECNGRLICGNEEEICYTFSKDTRSIQKGDTYLGIKGEVFNGSEFWKEALDKDASTCILQDVDISEDNIDKYYGKNIIMVENVVKALQQLARYKRSLYDIPVVAITGSVGKTSTKDVIASVVNKKYKTLKTEGNLNNEVGLPLTILKLKDHEAMVVEMGSDKFGDIDLLTNIAKPTIAVVTMIGTSHIANFGTRDNILKEKLEILNGIENKKVIIINKDNDLLNKWYDDNINGEYEIITYGTENDSDYLGYNIMAEESQSKYDIKVDGKEYNVIVPVSGKHFVYNSLSAIAVGRKLGIDMKDIITGISDFKLTKMRMDVVEFKNDIKIINDTYNASFDSVKSGIDVLKNIQAGRRIAILADMLELGEYSKELHEKTGAYVAENGVDVLVTIGNEAKHIANSALKNNMLKKDVYVCDSREEAKKIIKEILKSGDTVLIKGSRGMKLDELFNDLSNMLERV